MNPLNLIKQYIMQGLTPKGILSKINVSNPMLSNVITMAQNGDTEGVEKFARNICEQKGIDFDTEFAKFKNNLK